MFSTRRRENQILLAACRADSPLDGEAGRREREWASSHARPLNPAAWERLIVRAEALGVAPQLHLWAQRAPAAAVPNLALSKLQAAYYAQAARGAELHTAVADLLAALEQRGVPAILLKGMALAQPVYGNIALRPMADIDVLVRRSALDAAGEAARALGYEWSEWYRPREWYLTNHHHLAPLEAPDARMIVELHWNIVPPSAGFAVDAELLWSRARTETVHGREVAVLAPDDLVLHLALHAAGTSNFVAGLANLRDIAYATHRYGDGFEWDRFCASARSFRAARHCYYAVWLAHAVLGGLVSPAALHDLRLGARTSRLEDRHIKAFGLWAMLRERGESSALPGDLLNSWSSELFRERSWLQRIGTTSRSVYLGWRDIGHRKGLGRWAGLYGLLIHPWAAAAKLLSRRLRAARSVKRGLP